MSNYTRTTNFTAKDGLASGNPAKLIKGSDFQLEFDNIASASASKANLASPTFTGTVTIPTANITTLTAGGLSYPTSDGTSGQFLTTDGAGALSFTSASSFDPDTAEVELGLSASATGTNGISIGASASSTQADAVLLGRGTGATGTGGVAIGATASTSDVYSIAVGYGASATGTSAVAMGYQAAASATFGTAVGRNAAANTGSFNTAIGYGSTASNYATAINQATASGARSIAIGHTASAAFDDAIAIGYSSTAGGLDAIGIGNLAGADAAGSLHINASGVITNQPQTAGHMVIETSGAKIEYDGNWDLSSGNLTVNGDLSATGLSGSSLTLGGVAVTSTAAELNYVDGVTSNVQTQLNAKAPLDNPTFTTDVTVPQLSLGDWTIELSTNDLVFKYLGTSKFKLATTGELTATDDLTAFGTI